MAPLSAPDRALASTGSSSVSLSQQPAPLGDAEDLFTVDSDEYSDDEEYGADKHGPSHRLEELDEAIPSERQGLVARSVDGDQGQAQGESGETGRLGDADQSDFSGEEPQLTVPQAIRVYRKAIFWCLVTSACVIMEGYDMILIGNFFAYPAFARKYGQFVDSHGQHQLSPAWQAALSNSSPVGCFVGTWLNGLLVARFGQKRVLLAALAALSLTIFLTFFAPSIEVLMVGELLCGVPWGIFASSAPAYASEILPTCLRSYLTSWTNMCFIIGQLISAGVLAGLAHRTDEWAYRIPFGLQWAWPVLIFPVLCFAPESPWHLVRKGRREEARAALRKLQTEGETNKTMKGGGVDATLATIERTNALEMYTAGTTAATRYWDCFRGTERRRTEIACVAFAAQVLAGSPFAYNSTYFYQQVGLSTRATYLLNTCGTVLALMGTVINWLALMPRYGRRPIFLAGLATMAALLLAIGILSLFAASSGVALTQAALTLAWTLVFQLSVGQLGWALPAEVGSTRLRQKTVCLARNAYYAASITSNVVEAQLLNPGALDWKGRVGFFWGASCALVLVWAFFRLPETKGRSYEELDWLFAKRTATRTFATSRVPRDDHSGVSTKGLFVGDEERHVDDYDEDAVELERLVGDS